MKSTSLLLISIASLIILGFADINKAEKIEFGYTGKIGPAFWNLLTPESEICATGKKQSPIDITSDDLKTLAESPSPKFNDADNVVSTNNGNTVEISSGNEEEPLPAEIKVDGETYKLQQFHFHTPSEHRVNGLHHDIEQHLVFKSDDDKVSVVAVFYDVGNEKNAFMTPIIDNLPENLNDTKNIKKVDLSGLLTDIDDIKQAFTYSGSLTTPPCTEGVTWYVNKNAQEISGDQFSKLRSVTGFNSRFTQLRENENEPPSVPPSEPPSVPPSVPADVNNNTDAEIKKVKKHKRSFYVHRFKY